MTKKIKIGNLTIGGKEPVRVQSMTNVETRNVKACADQINELTKKGCEIVRVAVVNQENAKAIKQIKKQINIPLVADIHFDYRLALTAIEAGADKIRINPGNIKNPAHLKAIVDKAKNHKVALRIGVNSGSIPADLLKKHKEPKPEAMVEAALRQAKIIEKLGFNNLVVSLKHHDVPSVIQAYRLIAQKIDYPLHLGVTEAGTFLTGTVKSAIAIGTLLQDGIGATFRISLTDDPLKEVGVAWRILEALNLRKRTPQIISCPTCGRTAIDVIRMANELEEKVQNIEKPIKIAVMGCLVNGPGEAKQADIGLSGMEKNSEYLMLFKKGKLIKKIKKQKAVEEVLKEMGGL